MSFLRPLSNIIVGQNSCLSIKSKTLLVNMSEPELIGNSMYSSHPVFPPLLYGKANEGEIQFIVPKTGKLTRLASTPSGHISQLQYKDGYQGVTALSDLPFFVQYYETETGKCAFSCNFLCPSYYTNFDDQNYSAAEIDGEDGEIYRLVYQAKMNLQKSSYIVFSDLVVDSGVPVSNVSNCYAFTLFGNSSLIAHNGNGVGANDHELVLVFDAVQDPRGNYLQLSVARALDPMGDLKQPTDVQYDIYVAGDGNSEVPVDIQSLEQLLHQAQDASTEAKVAANDAKQAAIDAKSAIESLDVLYISR